MVECHLAKVDVEGSSPFSRSSVHQFPDHAAPIASRITRGVYGFECRVQLLEREFAETESSLEGAEAINEVTDRGVQDELDIDLDVQSVDLPGGNVDS